MFDVCFHGIQGPAAILSMAKSELGVIIERFAVRRHRLLVLPYHYLPVCHVMVLLFSVWDIWDDTTGFWDGTG